MFWFLLRMFLVHLLATHLLSTQTASQICLSDTEICLRPFVLRQSEVCRGAVRMLMKLKSSSQRELFLFLAISSALEVNLTRFPILICDEKLCERAQHTCRGWRPNDTVWKWNQLRLARLCGTNCYNSNWIGGICLLMWETILLKLHCLEITRKAWSFHGSNNSNCLKAPKKF